MMIERARQSRALPSDAPPPGAPAADPPADASRPPVLTFGIPLRSAATARDWSRVCRLLDQTLASALAQPDVAAIVACHELPDTAFRDDPRVTFLQADIPPPPTVADQCTDKRHKKEMVLAEQCRRGGGYMMILDADDLVSNRLARHVAAVDNRRGYLLSHGYVFNARRRHIRLTEHFDGRCGSCGIFHLSPGDVASGWTATLADARHKAFAEVSARAGRPLDPVAFPASLYVFNHGDNLSMAQPQKRSARMAALVDRIALAINRMIPGRGGSRALRAEFSLSDALHG